MKAINRKVQKHPSPLQVAGKRSNNYFFEKIISRKASCIACLFLLLAEPLSFAQDLVFDSGEQQAYSLALALRPTEALEKVSEENSIGAVYIASLAEAIELLVTEDFSKFQVYEDRFLKRLDKHIKSSPRAYQFLQAEIRLQWAFVYLKFGHELDASLRLRQAYQIAEACKEKFPEYLPIRKTTGLLQIIIGSVPDKYSWLLSLLNMRGTLSAGLGDLRKVGASAEPLALEAKLLHALVEGFLLAQPTDALKDMQHILAENPGNPLIHFLTASLAIKDSESALALRLLKEMDGLKAGVPLYYADYLKGEAYLHKGDYLNSISSYRWFINHQTGQNYIKDAWYKIGLCYWLNGNENDALLMFDEARNKGQEATEADKAASRSLSEKEPPNTTLSKVRYFTDGGYYREAEKLLTTVSEKDFTLKKDLAEYYYRRARLAHKMNNPDAMRLYEKTIEVTGLETWYFAPNACLQLGYLYRERDQVREAKAYFERALTYKRHEYKNSIDSKARSALAQMTRI